MFTNVKGGGAHGHRDYNSITMVGYGNTLLADSGYFEYDTSDAFRQWGVSTEAHNTVLINNQNQVKGDYEANNYLYTGTIHDFVTNKEFDYLQQSTPNNTTYGEHMRTITFIKPGLVLVSDRMVPKDNTKINNYKQLWHMYPEANMQVDSNKMTVKSNFAEGGNIVISSAEGETSALKSKIGWYSKIYGKSEDGLYAYVEKNSVGTTYLDAALVTMPEGSSDSVTSERLTTQANATAMKLSLLQNGDSFTGYYYLSYDENGGSFGPYETDAQMAYIQLDAEGNVYLIVLKDGSYIKETASGKIIFKSDEKQEELYIDFSGRDINITGNVELLSSAKILANEDAGVLYIGSQSYSYDVIDGYIVNIGNGSFIGEETEEETDIKGVTSNKDNKEEEDKDNEENKDNQENKEDEEKKPASSGGGGGSGSSSGGGMSGGSISGGNAAAGNVVFGDTVGHWAREYIIDLKNKNIVTGDENGNFNPNNQITRAEFIAIVTRALGMGNPEYQGTFADVSHANWYAKPVQAALSGGLISQDEQFRPNAPITRQEMAKIIAEAKKLSEKIESPESHTDKYSDKDSIAQWARGYVGLITASGLMSGREDGGFYPNDNSTRAEAATVISRMIKQ